MIIVTCENENQYGFDFEIRASKMRLTKNGKVKFEPHEDVTATLEFSSRAVSIEEGE